MELRWPRAALYPIKYIAAQNSECACVNNIPLPSFVKSLAEYVNFGTQDVRSAERRLHPIGRQRQFSDALAGRIGECIYDRGYRRPLRSFAGA